MLFITFRELMFAIVFEAGFAASRYESYRESFNDMMALDGMNYAREAFAINAIINRAKQAVDTQRAIYQTTMVN